MLNITQLMQKPQAPETDIRELVYTLTEEELYKLLGTISGLIEGRKQAKKREEELKSIYAKQAHYDEIESMRPLTAFEAANLLGVSISTVREMTRRDLSIGGLRCETIGRRIVIRRGYVDEWIATNRKNK